MTQTDDREHRVRQVVVAAAILGGLTFGVCGVLIGWRYLPGLWGEWIGTMVGVMTTPVFLEISFIFIGLTVVLTVNHWRRKREGDELVYLDRVEREEGEPTLPEHAAWAVYREKPLPGEMPSLLAQAEGALAIGDFEAATESLGAMSEEMLRRSETLAVRLELAKATGRDDLVKLLEGELGGIRPESK